MTFTSVLMLFAILAYLVVVVGIGVVLAKRNQTTEDFYLGGRKLGPFVTAMSAEASDMSSWLLMGLPGVAYVTGLADAAWTAIGLVIGTYINYCSYQLACGSQKASPLYPCLRQCNDASTVFLEPVSG